MADADVDRTVRSSDPDFDPNAVEPDPEGDCSAMGDLESALAIAEDWLMDAPMTGARAESRVIDSDELLRLVQRLNACMQHLEDDEIQRVHLMETIE